MKIRVGVVASKIAFINLCLLLPLSHLQSYFSLSGKIPLIKGRGYFLLLATLLMMVILLIKKHTLSMWKGLFLFFMLIVTSLTIIFFSSYVHIDDVLDRNILFFNFSVVFSYGLYFIAGLFLDNLEENKKLIVFLWLLMVGNLCFHYDFQSMSISLQTIEKDLRGVYLFLGDSFAIWSLLVLSIFQKRPLTSTCIFLSSTVVLFSLVSRSSLYAFILVFPLVVVFTKKSLKFYLLLIVILGLVLVTFVSNIPIDLSTRMFAFLNFTGDSSVISRSFLFEKGVQGIRQNWFLGDYLGQSRYAGLGGYIHNYLSLWRQFGLFPFISFSLLTFLFIFKSLGFFMKAVQKDESLLSKDCFFVLGGFFCLIEIIAARSYTSPFIWLFLGMSLVGKK